MNETKWLRLPTTDVEKLVACGQSTTHANVDYLGKCVRFMDRETRMNDAADAEWDTLDAAAARRMAEWDAAEKSGNLPAQRLSLDDLVLVSSD